MHTPPQLAYEVLKVKARDHACTQTGLHYHHSIKIFKLSDVGFYLYAVNMFYYHWLINKLLWPITGQNKTWREIRTEIYRVKEGGMEETPYSCSRSKR